MSIRLSHTAKNMYLQSPRSFFYHYYLNLRPEVMGSPLFFGSLIETGLEALFKGKTLEEALFIFRENFKKYKVNGKEIDLSNSDKVRYSKSDLDMGVFSEQDLLLIQDKDPQYVSWLSLCRKGEMLITAYSIDIFPRIKRVIATQVPFSLPNEFGDEIIGFADLICEWEDGRILLMDHKTSSMTYPEDAVSSDQYGKQTALYYEAFKDSHKIDAVGFFVLEKKIRKREPRVRTAIIIGTPPEELMEKTFDEFDQVLYNIKQGNFPCQSPNCSVYGQQCCYKRYCESGGQDLTGLVKVEKK